MFYYDQNVKVIVFKILSTYFRLNLSNAILLESFHHYEGGYRLVLSCVAYIINII